MTTARARDTVADALRGGDPRAFERLFTQHADQLRRVAYAVVRSRETAAELVQDVFLGLWNARDRLDLRDGIRTYLTRATRNRALDWVAREALHRRWVESAHVDDVPHSTNATDDHEESERHRELQAALAGALDEMPDRQREVCRLRWQVGLGPTAIAEKLGVAVKTVETQIYRGLVQLRAKLKAPGHA